MVDTNAHASKLAETGHDRDMVVEDFVGGVNEGEIHSEGTSNADKNGRPRLQVS